MSTSNEVSNGCRNRSVTLARGDDEDRASPTEPSAQGVGHRLQGHGALRAYTSKGAQDFEILLVARIGRQVGQFLVVNRQRHGISAFEKERSKARRGDRPHFKGILQDRSDTGKVPAVEDEVEVGHGVAALFVDHQVASPCKGLPVDVLERVSRNIFS